MNALERKEFREDTEYHIKWMKVYAKNKELEWWIKIYGVAEGNKRFKDQKKYKNLFKNTNKLIGKVKYNYYTVLEFNNEMWYPASAVIEIPNNSKIFINN